MVIISPFTRVKLASVALLAVVAWCGLMQVPSASALGPLGANNPATPIRILADEQSLNLDQNKSWMRGNVKLIYGAVTIASPEADVALTPDGQAQSMTFKRRPTLVSKEPNKPTDTLVADTITLDILTESFLAQGNVDSLVKSIAAAPVSIKSDVQQYNAPTGLMNAIGSVVVHFEDTTITASKALLKLGPNNQAERIVFIGGVTLTKPDAVIKSERLTLLPATNILVAEGNVRTVVDVPDNGTGKRSKVFMNSAHQQFDDPGQKILASGNVRLLYEDYIVTGPKATFNLAKDAAGKQTINQIMLTGRPTIIEKSRKVTADTIKIVPNPKAFDAKGNVNTQLINPPKPAPVAAPPAQQGKGKGKGKQGVSLQPAKPANTPPKAQQTEEEELGLPNL
jgi:lipopolysaccharide export system protein LptA